MKIFEAMAWMKANPMKDIRNPGRGYSRYNPELKTMTILPGGFEYCRCERDTDVWSANDTLNHVHRYDGEFRLDQGETMKTETITIDGQEYEVLPIDRIGEITHAKLAGGNVVNASGVACHMITLCSPADYVSTRFGIEELEPFGIQPLKLLPKVPVEFVATFAYTGAVWYPLHCLDDGLSMQGKEQKKFRCVEVTE